MENRIFRISPGLFANGNGGNGKGSKEKIIPDYYLFTKDLLQNILKTIGKEKEFKKKILQCPHCNGSIRWKNLRAIVPNNGSFDFICDNPECFEGYLEIRNTKGG